MPLIRKPRFEPLSPAIQPALALSDCLAKTDRNHQAGRDVLSHCHIVGAVARALIQQMPDWLAVLFPHGSELIAACHDLGKVSPTFQKKIYSRCQVSIKPELKDADPKHEPQWNGHAGVSQVTLEHLKVGKFIPEIVGRHHGALKSINQIALAEPFGGQAWQNRREELLLALKHALNAEFPKIHSASQAQLLAGLTCVADWLGSGPVFDDRNVDGLALIPQALQNAGFIVPQVKPNLRFVDIFGFEPHQTQQVFSAHSQQHDVIILEAPMGHGKTEAALYLAYQLMSQQKATGLYFALPTQLTSDAIHQRVNQFLSAILLESQSALLVHGSAWLKQTELGEEGQANRAWFDHRKRGILAPFAVGTIDQALMAVLNVKHGFVRSFGLAGKVVILDEVHSYDTYTGTLLEELVRQCRAWQCTVIILSATLTQERRFALLGLSTVEQQTEDAAYPLISVCSQDNQLARYAVNALPAKTVQLRHCYEDFSAMSEALSRAEQGQQVLWLENTVEDAQQVFQRLSNQAMVECGLVHSRFLKVDRAEKEAYWVELYGKDAGAKRQKTGRILIGTQVLEQSLDIDADFLVSRFAPTDMLLQRLGRLWRHEALNALRPANTQCEMWLLVPELNAAIENAAQAFGKTAKVYAPYVLCRSLQVWQDKTAIVLPQQIRELLELTYCPREEQGAFLAYQAALEDKRKKLKALALYAKASANDTQPDTISTRYSEVDDVNVLLLRQFSLSANKQEVELVLLSGEVLQLSRFSAQNDTMARRQIAAQLLNNMVSVAHYYAPPPVQVQQLSVLSEYIYLGYGQSALRVALVNADGEIRALSGDISEKYALSYDKRLGYRVLKAGSV